MRNKNRESAAKRLADYLVRSCFDANARYEFNQNSRPDTAIVLGTGWGDACNIKKIWSTPLSKLRGFESLGELEGHKRSLIFGKISGRYVWVLSGRVHLNEAPADPEIYNMVRLQIELLCRLGVKNFILTNAAGSLHEGIRVGNLLVADGFITLFAPPMPLWAGEFCSPEDCLDSRLCELAVSAGEGLLRVHQGAYAMVRGPFFEGRKYDKEMLRKNGASVVGMSTLPESCVASLYKDEGAKVVCISFITNTDSEEHSHLENVARAKESSTKLGLYLERLIVQA